MNYITILSFMIDYLKLKNTDLILFAIIYSFNRDKEHNFKCEATNLYLSKSCGCSIRNVQKSLLKLSNDGFIKIRNYDNNKRYIGLNWKIIDSYIQES